MLNDQQRKVAFHFEGNTIVSASPGTGKTRTLVARAKYKLDSMPDNQSLALITYTNAGADEISSRLISENQNIFIGTIHRFCLEFILRPFGWIHGWDRPKIVSYDELKEFVELNTEIQLGDSPIDELNKIKRQLNGELDLSVDWLHQTSIQTVAQLYYSFLESKEAIDFNEILYRSYKIVSENDFVVDSLSSKFYEISVDEFQDTNIYQYEILKAINSKSNCSFFLVGDEKQKIYSFAGAIDNAFQQASTDFNAKVEELNVTYRSTTNIINAYSVLFENHPALKNESKYKSTDYKIVIKETTRDDNNGVIENYIDHLISKGNVPLSEIAILTTSWRDAFFISRHLRQKHHVVGLGALPHQSVSSSIFNLIRSISKFLYSPGIRNLRIIRRNIEFHALENNFLSDDRQHTFWTNDVVTKVKGLDLSLSLIQGLNELKSLFNSIFGVNHSEIDEIINHIHEDETNSWNLEKYFKTLSGVDGITVNTIHQSKGLEYEVVLLNGVNENRIPYQRLLDRSGWVYEPISSYNLENGRTLLYVGVSRAKAVLIMLHNWKPSLFVSEVKATNI